MRLIDADRMKEELLWGNVFLPAIQTNTLVDLIDNQPTIDPESLRPSGRWDDAGYVVWCSNCGEPYLPAYKSYKYCPNCGAKMEDTNEN